MALALVTNSRDITRRSKVVYINVTPSGSYVVGGDALDLTKVTNPKFISNGKPSAVPKLYEVVNAPAGYSAEIVAASTMAGFKLKVFSAPGTELTAVAYPAALTADSFLIRLSGPLGSF